MLLLLGAGAGILQTRQNACHLLRLREASIAVLTSVTSKSSSVLSSGGINTPAQNSSLPSKACLFTIVHQERGVWSRPSCRAIQRTRSINCSHMEDSRLLLHKARLALQSEEAFNDFVSPRSDAFQQAVCVSVNVKDCTTTTSTHGHCRLTKCQAQTAYRLRCGFHPPMKHP